ncbi:MAG: class I adenylate cyclase [Proteobacteria bacterium]|nr:class I adenylate cyclase [Pseudomonadota bacterium]MBU1737662.1 class I adenylate cyclase [Pseudomonadota bacterium]
MIKAIAFNESKAAFLFKIIPFLLHANYPDLPGFVDNEQCCFGICRLNPEKLVSQDLFSKYFPTSSALYHHTPDPFAAKPVIHSVKTIGSIGTIAQTEKSDCDYWLSIRQKDLTEKELELLGLKCTLIEEWADTRGIEVHFFLMDIEQTRENRFDTMADKESAGTALKTLLKDELFRTHILVAGKMLLWWLIPPGLTEEGYHQYVAKLAADRTIKNENFIDLGYMADIPKPEIFGACLWQMNKALNSPFKSVIKFAYLEMLMSEKHQHLPLFSDRIKSYVTFPEHQPDQKEKIRIADIDPYLLLARDIASFYQLDKSGEKSASLIKECLFMKTLEGMASQKKKGGEDNRIRQTMILMKNWQLLPARFEHFSKLIQWDYRELVDFGSKVHDYLIETYKRLREIFWTMDKELTISERDISTLGRKLFTFYEKKENKIEYIRSISRETMAQKNITFHITRYEDQDYYYAFQGKHSSVDIKEKTRYIIKRELRPLNLVTWLLTNGILTPKTKLHITKSSMALDLYDLQSLLEKMFQVFPPINFGHISAEQLLEAERVIQALVVVNIEKKPVMGGKTLESSIITTNSYGEYFIHDYHNITQLKNALQLLLTRHFVSRWNNNLDFFTPEQKESHQIKQLLFN